MTPHATAVMCAPIRARHTANVRRKPTKSSVHEQAGRRDNANMGGLRPAGLALALVAMAAACGDGASTAPTQPPAGSGSSNPPVAPAHLLVVTHTAGFRHDSIP